MRRERRSSTYVQILKKLFVAGKPRYPKSGWVVTVTSWNPAWRMGVGINGLPGRNTRTYFCEMATAVKSTGYPPHPALLAFCPALGPNGNNRKTPQ